MSTDSCITANLEALQTRLIRAAALVGEARLAMAEAKRNQAIGTILELDETLPECDILFKTIIMQHRARRRDEEVQP